MPDEKCVVPFSIEFLVDKLKDADNKVCMFNLKGYEFKVGTWFLVFIQFVQKFNTGQAFMSEIVQLSFEWREPTALSSVILKVNLTGFKFFVHPFQIPGFQNPSKDQDVEQAVTFLEYAHEVRSFG